jgi:hypothetical protein
LWPDQCRSKNAKLQASTMACARWGSIGPAYPSGDDNGVQIAASVKLLSHITGTRTK